MTVSKPQAQSHVVVGTDEINHPYRVQCACGEWCYDFDAHLERVAAKP